MMSWDPSPLLHVVLPLQAGLTCILVKLSLSLLALCLSECAVRAGLDYIETQE